MRDCTVGMVCFGDPHPSHRGFANAIGAELIQIGDGDADAIRTLVKEIRQGIAISDYDFLIAEGSRPLYATLANSSIRNTRLVYLCADHRLYELWNSEIQIDSFYTLFKAGASRFGKPAIKHLCQTQIDGVIAVSQFAAEFVRPIVGQGTPIEIAHPFIQPEKYNTLGGVEPTLDGNTAVTVGQASRYKGVDMLVEAWPDVRAENSKAELHVVGSGHPKSYEDTEGVIVHGFVEDLTEVFAKASLYVQSSRMDTFPVSVLEALRAGLPTIVTETTGSRSEIEELDQNMIVKPTPKGLEDATTTYFDKDIETRSRLSGIARNRSEQFNQQTKKAEFKIAFERLTGVKNE